jgi:hypothetical protein
MSPRRQVARPALSEPATSFANIGFFDPVPRKEARCRMWDREFESGFLQRRVMSEPWALGARVGRHAATVDLIEERFDAPIPGSRWAGPMR